MINNIKKSTLAGILIGLGVIINVQSEIPIIGALLFSFGLLTIIYMQLNLFTGKIGFSANYSIPFLLIMLLFNFIGITVTTFLYTLGNPNFLVALEMSAITKFSKDIFTLFFNGMFCGALIHFAVKNKQTILTIFAIMIFILIGAEHCVADFPYLLIRFSWINLLKLFGIIIGNSVGAIFIEGLCSWKNTQD